MPSMPGGSVALPRLGGEQRAAARAIEENPGNRIDFFQCALKRAELV
jgi:hypothetical protein